MGTVDSSEHRSRSCAFVDREIGQLLFALQQSLEISERSVGGQWLFLATRGLLAIPFRIQIPRVLIVVTIETQQLPVAPVGRIVIVVMVLVMNRELTKFLACKFATAPRTDPGVNLERLLPIGLLPTFPVAPSLCNDLVRLVSVWSCLPR